MPAAGTVVNWKVRQQTAPTDGTLPSTFTTGETRKALVLQDNGGTTADIVVFYDRQPVRLLKAVPNSEFV